MAPIEDPTTDRSRTPRGNFGTGKGKSKGKGKGKKGKRSGKGIPSEVEEEEKTSKRVFPGPSTMPEGWRNKKPEAVVISTSMPEKPPNATLAFRQASTGIPVFRRVWLVSDAPVRDTRLLGARLAGEDRARLGERKHELRARREALVPGGHASVSRTKRDFQTSPQNFSEVAFIHLVHSQTVICKPCSENSWTKG